METAFSKKDCMKKSTKKSAEFVAENACNSCTFLLLLCPVTYYILALVTEGEGQRPQGGKNNEQIRISSCSERKA